jgi:hypothetical protein
MPRLRAVEMMSRQVYAAWRADHKAVERQFAEM